MSTDRAGMSPERLLRDLREEQADLAALVRGADLRTPTPAAGWDVGDAIAHLRGTDDDAVRAVTGPQEFVAALPQGEAALAAHLQAQLDDGRELGERLLPDWQAGFERMVAALAALPAGSRLPWYGPPMSVASFVTARLMEYWAHGQDVADGLGVQRVPTDRLRSIAHLGVRTRGFSYQVRGLPAPDGDVLVELTGPRGDTWRWGEGPDAVRGPALDFCLLVTQRRARRDLALSASGPRADAWLDVAQCFAGPPGPGR